MTIVILARAKNGVVLAADTQATGNSIIGPKKVVSKILDLIWPQNGEDASILLSMGFAGNGAVISKLMTDIYTYVLGDDTRPADAQQFISLVERLFFTYYKMLNGDIPRNMGLLQPPVPFDVSAVLAGIYNGVPVVGKILPEPPMFVPVSRENYVIIGSGRYYGDLLMRMLYRPDESVEDVAATASYIISEVAQIDPNVGMPATIRTITQMDDGSIRIKQYVKDLTSVQPLVKHHVQSEFIKKLKEILDKERDIYGEFT
ncbi:MAG: hypothetical protein GXN93_04725 [Candidatus Diapherotrites archaeon]|nr:hypothetical protein [Candidatus Diapherotrites archaeon]